MGIVCGKSQKSKKFEQPQNLLNNFDSKTQTKGSLEKQGEEQNIILSQENLSQNVLKIYHSYGQMIDQFEQAKLICQSLKPLIEQLQKFHGLMHIAIFQSIRKQMIEQNILKKMEFSDIYLIQDDRNFQDRFQEILNQLENFRKKKLYNNQNFNETFPEAQQQFDELLFSQQKERQE